MSREHARVFDRLPDFPRGMKQDRPTSGGFTLIEILVVVSISAALIVALAFLFRTTSRAAVALQSNDSAWGVEQFWRRQLRAAALPLAPAGLIEGGSTRLVFPSYRSARAGFDGPPVLAQYRFDPKRRALLFQEIALPSWWGDNKPSAERILHALDDIRLDSHVLAKDIDEAQFAYYELLSDGTGLWTPSWPSTTSCPPLVRLRIKRVDGWQEIVAECGPAVAMKFATGG